MSRVLFLSRTANGYSLACKMTEQGDEVHFYIEEEKFQGTGVGKENPRVLKKPPAYTSDYDLIIPDMVGMGRLADRYRKAGKVVLSGGALGDTVELDKDFSRKVISLSEVKIPEKGDIPEGIELSTTIWFNGREEVPPFIHSIKNTRFMDGGRGFNTDGMGSIVWISEVDKIIEKAFIPLYPFLKKARYIGPLGITCTVSKDTLWFHNFTSRVEYDTIQIMGELIKDEWFNIFQGIAMRTLPRIPLYKGKYAIGVRLSMPPYPIGIGDLNLHGAQVVRIPKEATQHVWLSGVYYMPDGTPVMNGEDAVVGCITAWGETIREAQRRVYRTINNLSVCKDLQYRSDIGKGTEEKISKLKEWGWLNA